MERGEAKEIEEIENFEEEGRNKGKKIKVSVKEEGKRGREGKEKWEERRGESRREKSGAVSIQGEESIGEVRGSGKRGEHKQEERGL